MRVKLIVGFRRDQEHSVDADEAHKAYWLFLHPEQRGVFSNGLAIKGDQIQEIVPDYQGTMGWNATHVLDSDDWNELNTKGISRTMQHTLAIAKDIAVRGEQKELTQPLSKLIEEKYPLLDSGNPTGGMRSIRDIADKFKV